MTKIVRSASIAALRAYLAGIVWPHSPVNPNGIVDVTDTPTTKGARERFSVERHAGQIAIPTIRPGSTSLPMQDEWTSVVIVDTAIPGQTKPAAEARAEELADAVIAAMLLDPSLSGVVPGLYSVIPTGELRGPDAFELEDGVSHGWGCQFTITVAFKSRK